MSDCDTQERVVSAPLEALPARACDRLWATVLGWGLDPFPVALMIVAAAVLVRLIVGAPGTVVPGGVG